MSSWMWYASVSVEWHSYIKLTIIINSLYLSWSSLIIVMHFNAFYTFHSFRQFASHSSHTLFTPNVSACTNVDCGSLCVFLSFIHRLSFIFHIRRSFPCDDLMPIKCIMSNSIFIRLYYYVAIRQFDMYTHYTLSLSICIISRIETLIETKTKWTKKWKKKRKNKGNKVKRKILFAFVIVVPRSKMQYNS